MKKEYKTGLTIGKFAPLHKGHVDMIKFALENVDTLYIIVYNSPDKTEVPIQVRAAWIRDIFRIENVIVIEGYNAPNRHEDTLEVRMMQEEYIGKVMSSVKLTHFISSESYGDHLSKSLGVENLIYDIKRRKRNISSTMIRDNILLHRKQIPNQIIPDLKCDFEYILEEKVKKL